MANSQLRTLHVTSILIVIRSIIDLMTDQNNFSKKKIKNYVKWLAWIIMKNRKVTVTDDEF